MYRSLGQDDTISLVGQEGISAPPSATPPPGFQYSLDANGNWILTPTAQAQPTSVEITAPQLIAPSPAQAPAAAPTASSSASMSSSSLAQLLAENAAQGIPVVATNPTQAAQATVAQAAALPAGTSTLDYWLAQSTGGLKNTYIFWGAIVFGGAILLTTMLKKKR